MVGGWWVIHRYNNIVQKYMGDCFKYIAELVTSRSSFTSQV